MQAVQSTQALLNLELSTPLEGNQTPRTKEHMVEVLTDSRDMAVCNLLSSMTPVTRLCLGLPAALRARIRANRRSKCLARALATPLCTRYLLVLRARAASRLIARDRVRDSLRLSPPRLDPSLDFDTLSSRTPWLVLRDDGDRGMVLYHRETGATRLSPWIALRTRGGRVYFGNLVTRATRWLPPPGWHDSWISLSSPFDRRTHSYYTRSLLPGSFACLQIEGGAQFVHPLEAACRYLNLQLDSNRSTLTGPSV
jgi:hypothetical protein